MSIKRTTKIVGLEVIPNAREVLCSLYNKTLSLLAEMPSKSAYRQNTERIIKERLKIVSTETDDNKIESIIKQGQMEELVDKAKRECSLTEKMLVWEPWKPSLGPPPPGQWDWPV
ncbi:NADH dehydrogenase [Oopsacas minuta]|uniref:NADH dehydrogenase n=1 Tax=Oopsacas minuta TaxID=111878 RepID=A0AAV7JSD1_9METZ|nr:NADH dehydrogenase [Oopsacas minuta]